MVGGIRKWEFGRNWPKDGRNELISVSFIDGNKRVSTVACLLFLRLNGYPRLYDEPQLVELVYSVASGNADKNMIISFLSGT